MLRVFSNIFFKKPKGRERRQKNKFWIRVPDAPFPVWERIRRILSPSLKFSDREQERRAGPAPPPHPRHRALRATVCSGLWTSLTSTHPVPLVTPCL